MLLNFLELVAKHNISVKGVIQVGAHYAQEHDEYLKAGIKKFAYIEPCKETFAILETRRGSDENVMLFNCACGEENGEMEMNTGSSNQGQSNSLLKMAKHLTIHPGIMLPTTEKVTVMRLDSLGLMDQGYDLLTMDCQGYEGWVLRGGLKTLQQANWVYSEVNRDEVYEGCTKVEELDQLLHEFERIETGPWVGGMWTDALYKRKGI